MWPENCCTNCGCDIENRGEVFVTCCVDCEKFLIAIRKDFEERERSDEKKEV